MFYFVLPMVGRKLTSEILLLVDMVSSYSLELSQKTVPTSFILNYNLIWLLILKLYKKVFLINAYLHPNIYGM